MPCPSIVIPATLEKKVWENLGVLFVLAIVVQLLGWRPSNSIVLFNRRDERFSRVQASTKRLKLSHWNFILLSPYRQLRSNYEFMRSVSGNFEDCQG